jgi:hypothetical protein
MMKMAKINRKRFLCVIFPRFSGNQTTKARSKLNATIIHAEMHIKHCTAAAWSLQVKLLWVMKLKLMAPPVMYFRPYATQSANPRTNITALSDNAREPR